MPIPLSRSYVTLFLVLVTIFGKLKEIADLFAIKNLPHDIGELIIKTEIPYWFWAICAIALVVDTIIRFSEFLLKRSAKAVSLLFILLSATVLIVSIYMYFQPIVTSSAIESDFANAYNHNIDRLGARVDRSDSTMIVSAGATYLASHEYGTVLWIKETGKIYLLRGKDYLSLNNNIWPSGDYYYDEKTLRKRFKDIPEGLYPPLGGIAQNWEELKSAGWRREYSCAPTAGQILLERLPKGIIVGPFPASQYSSEGYLYMLYNDNSWDLYPAKSKVPNCQ